MFISESKLKIAWILAGSLLMTMWLWSDNLQAQWGMIDDHEIIRILGTKNTVTLSEISEQFRYSEARNPGMLPRYRPAYSILKFAEAWMWGANPHLWYIARMSMFCISLAILWWLAAEGLGLLLAAGFCMYLLTSPYWPGLWACLGAGESYCCFGLALAALGTYLLWMRNQTPGAYAVSWILVDVGVVVAAGSKENFVLLALPLAWLLIRERRAGRLRPGLGVAGALTLTYCLFIGGVVVLIMSRQGADMYGNSVAIGKRSSLVLNLLSGSEGFRFLVTVIPIAIWVSRYIFHDSSQVRAATMRGILQRFALTESILAVVYAGQIIFYDGGWQADSRYAFPGDTAIIFGVLYVPLYFLLECRQFMPQAAARRVATYLGSALIVFSCWLGYDASKLPAKANARRTKAFSSALVRIEQAAAKDQAVPVVLWSAEVGDFEKIIAVSAFVKARGVKNPVLLQTASPYPSAGLTPQLAALLSKEIEGIKAGERGFARSQLFEEARSCVAIGFYKDAPLGKCTSLGHILDE